MHPRNRAPFVLPIAASVLLAVAPPPAAADWNNSGGNAQRNGLTTEIGPTSAALAWSGGRTSLIAWLPVTEGDRTFMVRQARWPYQQPHDAYVVAMDLITGQELWAIELPYESGDWTPWIAGARDGRVYASRSGNGASVSARLFALDAADGHTIWISADEQDAGSYDGVVFAPDGDLIVASFQDIWRFNAEDGATVWHVPRVGSVSGQCGCALFGDAIYIVDVTGGGHILVRHDLATGARMYEGPLMPGFLTQQTPMVGPDGRIYVNRAQNNVAVDFYYSFTDTGTQIAQNWRIPSVPNAAAEYGIGPDGSLYFMVSGPRVARVDPTNGAILSQTAILPEAGACRFAIDANGTVFFGNGGFASGRLFSYEPDLTPRWDVPVTNINIGGPSLGRYGTLVVCGVGNDVRAYRTTNPADAAALASPPTTGPLRSLGPNPFHDRTEIRIQLGRPGAVLCQVFDPSGRQVRTLLRSPSQAPGEHPLIWAGTDDAGEPLPAGPYYLLLQTPEGTAREKILLLR